MAKKSKKDEGAKVSKLRDIPAESFVSTGGEEWRPITGYEGCYEVSSLGRVRSIPRMVNSAIRFNTSVCRRGYTLKISYHPYGAVSLSMNNNVRSRTVHRLVAQAFIPNPDNLPQVNHVDGDKANNRADNLGWCTQSQNMEHAFSKGLQKPMRNEQHKGCKLSVRDVATIRLRFGRGDRRSNIARDYKVSYTTIWRICAGELRRFAS